MRFGRECDAAANLREAPRLNRTCLLRASTRYRPELKQRPKRIVAGLQVVNAELTGAQQSEKILEVLQVPGVCAFRSARFQGIPV
jgi:hypothetical protein